MARIWYRSIFDIVEECRMNGLVICGTGFWAKKTYDIFRRFGITAKAFVCWECNSPADDVTSLSISIISVRDALINNSDACYLLGASSIRCADNIERVKMGEYFRLEGIDEKYFGFDPLRYYFLVSCCGIDGIGRLEAELYSSDFDTDKHFTISDLNSLVYQTNINRSGSVLFAQLCDGHPNLISLPPYWYYNVFMFATPYTYRLRFLSGFKLAIEIIAQIPYIINQDIHCTLNSHIDGIDGYEGYFDCQGQLIKDGILVKPKDMLANIYYQIRYLCKFTFGELFKGLFAAYANAINTSYDTQEKYFLFMHPHVFGGYTLGLFKFFDEVFSVSTVQESVKALASSINSQLTAVNPDSKYFGIAYPFNGKLETKFIDGKQYVLEATNDETMIQYSEYPLNGLSNVLECARYACVGIENYPNIPSYVARLEDFKTDSVRVMNSFCDKLLISFDPILLHATVNKIPVFEYNFFSYRVGLPELMNESYKPHNKYYEIAKNMLSDFDIRRIKLIFNEVNDLCGYSQDNESNFSTLSIGEKRELLSQSFKFCDDIQNGINIIDSSIDVYSYQNFFADLYFFYSEVEIAFLRIVKQSAEKRGEDYIL